MDVTVWACDLVPAAESASRRDYRQNLLHRILGYELAIPAYEVSVTTQCQHCGHPTHGKPRLASEPALHFSAAACADLYLVAVSRGAIGIDVERRDVYPVPDQQFVDACFSPTEQEAVSDLVGTLIGQGGLQAFVIKEAVGKAAGLGLLVDLGEAIPNWHISRVPVDEDYVCYLASERPVEVEVRRDPPR